MISSVPRCKLPSPQVAKDRTVPSLPPLTRLLPVTQRMTLGSVKTTLLHRRENSVRRLIKYNTARRLFALPNGHADRNCFQKAQARGRHVSQILENPHHRFDGR